MFTDTDPNSAEFQAEMRPNMPSLPYSSLVGITTTEYFAQAKRTIALANPGVTQREIDHIFISTHYGEKLAQEVTAYLQARDANANREPG